MAFSGGAAAPSAPAVRVPRVRAARPKAAPKVKAPRVKRTKAPRPSAKSAQATNPLYDPTATLSGQPLIDAATAMSDATYNPQIAEIKRQQGSNVAQGTKLMSNAGDYYHQLAQQEATGIARETAIGQLLQSQQGAVGAQTQGAFQQMSTDEAARQAADQAVRGGGLGGTGPDAVAAAITGGQGRSAQYQQAAQNSSAEQAANWENLANANLLARQVHGGEIQGQLANSMANTNRTLSGKLTDLSGQRANNVTKNVVDLRQQGFTNLATLQGLGIKQSDLAASVAKANQSNATAIRRISTSAKTAAAGRKNSRDIAAANRTAAAQRQQKALDAKTPTSKRPRTGLGSLTQTQENKAYSDIGTAQQVINQYAGKLDANTLLAGLAQGGLTDASGKRLAMPKIDPLYAKAALELRHGGLTPETIRQLHLRGVHVGGRYQARGPQTPSKGGLLGGILSGISNAGT